MNFRTLESVDRHDRKEGVYPVVQHEAWFKPKTKEVELGPNIKVLPMFPLMRYRYTCWKCGCNAVHHVGFEDWFEGWEIVMCATCKQTWKEFM